MILRLLLSRLLPPDVRADVLRDLDDEYARVVRPGRGAVRARFWYCQQSLRSLPAALSMRRRRRAVARAGAAAASGSLPLRIEQLPQDLRFAWRSLRRRPAFALAAAATMALGIGATTAIFTLVDAVVLRPLPYLEPDRLVRVWSANPRGIPRNSVSPPDFFDFRDQAVGMHAFQELAAYTNGDPVTMLDRGGPQRLLAAMVSPSLFDVLAVQPLSGRTLAGRDAQEDGANVVVVSHEFWRTRLSARPDAVGEAITLDGSASTIVGIMPASFGFPSAAVDMWVPMPASLRLRSRTAHFLDVIGRLAPGVAEEHAAGVLRTVAARIEAAHPQKRGWSVTTASLHESIVGDVRRPLLLLLAVAGCVLVVACANVANLFLARGLGRDREMAVRAALGATRVRVAAQQLTETLIVAAAGGAAGVACAWLGLRVLLAQVVTGLPRADQVAIDARTLAAASILVVVAALVSGLLPAFVLTRRGAEDALRAAGAAGAGRAAHRSQSALVVGQIAATLALVVCAGLLGRSFLRLTQVDAGFRADATLLAQVSFSTGTWAPDVWSAFYTRLLDEVRTIPGVVKAGAGTPLPLSGQPGLLRFGVRIGGQPDPPAGQNDRAYVRWITPGYFDAMGIPLLEGRDFSSVDSWRGRRVAIVDRTFVERYFLGLDPIGRQIRPTNERELREIVGVVGAVRPARLEDPAEPHLYVPHAQSPMPGMTLVVRADRDASTLAQDVRAAIRRIDPDRPVYNLRTLADVVGGSVAARRGNATLMAAFAALATVLMIVGVYGLMAGRVAESTREIGVRVALGARAGDVAALVLWRGLRLALVGIAGGILLALAGTRSLAGLLYAVPPVDPLVFAAAACLVLMAAAAASYLPARRAAAIDPALTLRE